MDTQNRGAVVRPAIAESVRSATLRAPAAAGETIEVQLLAVMKRGAFGHHADLPEHPMGGPVLGMSDRDDGVEAEHAEAMGEHGAGRLGGDTLAPGRRDETVADLDQAAVLQRKESAPAEEAGCAQPLPNPYAAGLGPIRGDLRANLGALRGRVGSAVRGRRRRRAVSKVACFIAEPNRV
jgi:hypothetical protein